MSYTESGQKAWAHIFNHMSRGQHPAYQPADALWDAHNIRLTSREGETKFAIVNEKSTREVYNLTRIFASKGPVYLIGQAVVGDYLAVFLHKDEYTIEKTTEVTDDDGNTTTESETISCPDCILRFDMTTYDADAKTIDDPVILYRGDLGFDHAHPMQCVIDKESEKIEKIYWTDGVNKPRMINICKPELVDAEYDSAGDDEQDIANTLGYTAFYPDAPFDFVQTMTLDEECSVERLASGSGGVFPAGTIQYALTYYFKYGQETNIFYVSEILYMSYADRGAAADESSLNCAFRITVKNPESDKFDYMRIYSIKRTSLEGTVVAQQVADINLHDEKSLLYDDDDTPYVQFVDTNTTGTDIDSDKLLYLGGKDIVCGCMCSKDNTLFMGDITWIRKDLAEIDFSDNTDELSVNDYFTKNIGVGESYRVVDISANDSEELTTNEDTFYHWKNQLRVNTSTFKRGETYRLGIQFQYKTGEWSEPVWVGDYEMSYSQTPKLYTSSTKWTMRLPQFYGAILKDDAKDLIDAGYLKVRPLVVFPDTYDRKILAQGVVSPTVFQSQARRNNAPFSFSSWLFRFMGSEPTGDEQNDGLYGSIAQWHHFWPLTSGRSSGAEIQNMAIAEDYIASLSDTSKYRVLGDYDAWCAVTGLDKVVFDTDLCVHYFDLQYIYKMLEGDSEDDNLNGDCVSAYGIWYVDWSTCTLHSPDIEFLTSIQIALDHSDNIGIRIVGAVPFMQSYGDIDIDLTSVQADPEAHGFTSAITHSATNGGRELISGLFFHDSVLDDYDNGETIDITNYDDSNSKAHYKRMWMTHLWHRAGSLNNDMARNDDDQTRTAELNTKIIANIHYSEDNIWFTNELINDDSGFLELDVDDHECFYQEDVQLSKLHDKYAINGNDNYYGNVDFMNASYTPFKLVCSESNNANYILKDEDGNEVTSDKINLQYSISYNANLRYQQFENNDSEETGGDGGLIGNNWTNLVTPTEGVRMKYLSTPHLVFNLAYVDEKYRESMPLLHIDTSYSSSSSNSDSGTGFDMETDLGFTIAVASRDTMSLYSGDTDSAYTTNVEPLMIDDSFHLYYAVLASVSVYESDGLYSKFSDNDYGDEYTNDDGTSIDTTNVGFISFYFYDADGNIIDTSHKFAYGLFNSSDAIKLEDLAVTITETTNDDGNLAYHISFFGKLSFPDAFIEEYGDTVEVKTGRYSCKFSSGRTGDYYGTPVWEYVDLQGLEVSATYSIESKEDLEELIEGNVLTFQGTASPIVETIYGDSSTGLNVDDISEDDTIYVTLSNFVDVQLLSSLLSIVETDDSDSETESEEEGEEEETDETTSSAQNSWYTQTTLTSSRNANIYTKYQYWLEFDDDEGEDLIKQTNFYISYQDIIGAAPAYWNENYGWDDIADVDSDSNYYTPKAYLWLCEVYQKDIVNKFGGDSKDALQINIWLPAGPSVSLEGGCQVEWQWGDTWYQRYDCLKTYPFSDEDTNQVIEIGSFMCETHYNLDGRYDRNRALVSNINVNHQNFNLMNDVYNQKNDYFTYQINDEYWYKTNKYPSQVWWTNTKSAIADIDEYTHLHLASSMDLDGTFGKVTAIAGYKDQLFVLQDKAVLQLAFNDKSIITSESGVSVEIANSEKVSDYTTVHTNVGCQDKFAVTTTPSGIYFLDYNNCTMYLLQGSNRTEASVVDLVETTGSGDNIALYGLGSNYWFRENRPSYTWRPILSTNRLVNLEDEYMGKQNGIALFYDPKYGDVYAIPGLDNLNTYRDALCNSEELRAFTSFMSYGGATMFSHEAKMFAIAYQRNAVYYEDTGYEQEIESDTAALKLYELWSDSEKTYNNIFGVIEPFSFTFVCNEYPTFTKVFDNIDIRMDQYDYNEETGQTELVGGTYSVAHQAGQPFNYIQVKNEYQDTGVKAFNPMALRKKFRVWRAQIPRNGNGRDRIRNTWAMITLGNDDPGTALSIVHDINVNFSI